MNERLKELEKAMKEKDRELERIENLSKKRAVNQKEVSHFLNTKRELKRLRREYLKIGDSLIRQKMREERNS